MFHKHFHIITANSKNNRQLHQHQHHRGIRSWTILVLVLFSIIVDVFRWKFMVLLQWWVKRLVESIYLLADFFAAITSANSVVAASLCQHYSLNAELMPGISRNGRVSVNVKLQVMVQLYVFLVSWWLYMSTLRWTISSCGITACFSKVMWINVDTCVAKNCFFFGPECNATFSNSLSHRACLSLFHNYSTVSW